jgi:hypothetical protein
MSTTTCHTEHPVTTRAVKPQPLMPRYQLR